MSRRPGNESNHDIVVNEISHTIGSGGRKRELKLWEASWIPPLEVRREGKPPQLFASSKISRADAISQLEEMISDYLA